MSFENLDIEQAESEFKITVVTKNVLRIISIWSQLSAILGLIISGLACFVLYMMIADFMSRDYFQEDQFFGMCIWGAAIVFVIFLSRFLLVYARNWKKSVALNSSLHLEKALKGLKNALIMNAVIFMILTILGALLLGVIVYAEYMRYW